MSNNMINIELPLDFLIEICVKSTIEIDGFFKKYVEQKLYEKGYHDEVNHARDIYLEELRSKIRKTLGDSAMDQIDSTLKDAGQTLEFLLDKSTKGKSVN